MTSTDATLAVAVSRRAFLHLAGAGALAVGVSACAGGMGRGPTGTGPRSSSATPGPAGAGAAFTQPAELRSAGGALDVTLVAAPATVPWGDGTRYALAYNGTVPGPTLRVCPGDVLTVTLENRLDQPTNLHTHGLHVSPEGESDNIFVMVGPGERRTYRYRIPADHPSGTFWYHPHHHGTVAAQLSGGLAGLIVVEDAVDAALAAATTERVIILADPRVGADASTLTVPAAEQMAGRQGDVVVVNGLLQPRLAVTAGSVERWRVLNASPSRYYRLSVPGPAMQLLASDHGRLERPVALTGLLLTPGQRAELAVPFDRAGSYALHTAAVDRGGMMGGGMMGGRGNANPSSPAADLMTITVADGPAAAPPQLPAMLRPAAAATGPVTNRRTLTLGAMGMGASAFVIDGRPFDPARTDQRVALGAVEEWTLRNTSMMDHPFHLHVWPFQVVARSDGAPDPGWRDTVNVPAGGTVTIRIPFTDFGGRTVYHCHILDHEDLGMMGITEVA